MPLSAAQRKHDMRAPLSTGCLSLSLLSHVSHYSYAPSSVTSHLRSCIVSGPKPAQFSPITFHTLLILAYYIPYAPHSRLLHSIRASSSPCLHVVLVGNLPSSHDPFSHVIYSHALVVTAFGGALLPVHKHPRARTHARKHARKHARAPTNAHLQTHTAHVFRRWCSGLFASSSPTSPRGYVGEREGEGEGERGGEREGLGWGVGGRRREGKRDT